MEYKTLLVQLPLSGKEPLPSGFPHTDSIFLRWVFWLQAGPRRFGSHLALRPLPPALLLNAACSLVREVVCALSEVQNQSLTALVDGVSMERCICWTVRCHQSNGGMILVSNSWSASNYWCESDNSTGRSQYQVGKARVELEQACWLQFTLWLRSSH